MQILIININFGIVKHFVLIILSFCFIAVQSCKKPKNSAGGGGKGGNATIIARADHANAFLDTSVIYIKYGTLNAPANGVNYDDSLIADTNCMAVFGSLTQGSYYLFSRAIHDPYNPATVDGGEPWVIKSNNELDTVNIACSQNFFTFPTWWHPL